MYLFIYFEDIEMSTSKFPDVMLRLLKVRWGEDSRSGNLNLHLHRDWRLIAVPQVT